MKLNILGEKYEISEERDILKEDAHGTCDRFKKEIRICPSDLMFPEDSDAGTKDEKYKEVMRHEIVHAFLFEAGMESYSQDELLVQWIAFMYPKLSKAFKDTDCE